MVANQMAKNKVVAKMVLTREEAGGVSTSWVESDATEDGVLYEVVKVSFTKGGRKATVHATVYEDRQVGLSGLRWE